MKEGKQAEELTISNDDKLRLKYCVGGTQNGQTEVRWMEDAGGGSLVDWRCVSTTVTD